MHLTITDVLWRHSQTGKLVPPPSIPQPRENNLNRNEIRPHPPRRPDARATHLAARLNEKLKTDKILKAKADRLIAFFKALSHKLAIQMPNPWSSRLEGD